VLENIEICIFFPFPVLWAFGDAYGRGNLGDVLPGLDGQKHLCKCLYFVNRYAASTFFFVSGFALQNENMHCIKLFLVSRFSAQM
jgi:hypothetical protein